MLIDGTITKEVYDDNLIEFNCKLHTLAGKRQLLEESINKQKDVGKRMAELRLTLENEEILDEFDRVAFESIIDRVIVGGYSEDGTVDTYKLTFVLKGNYSGVVPKDFHFHMLRHTCTSNLLANGEAPRNVQELLGQADVSTTMKLAPITFNPQGGTYHVIGEEAGKAFHDGAKLK